MKYLEKITRALAVPEGRKVGTPGHRRARDLIVHEMAGIGLVPYQGDSFLMPYESWGSDDNKFWNIAGAVKSLHPSRSPIFVVAHYDSVIEAPCADDNAASVAIALGVGRSLMRLRDTLERDVVILIPDAEEPPYFHSNDMGSSVFVQEQLDNRGVHSAIVLDLVGHDVDMKGLRDLTFVTGAESHPSWKKILESSKTFRKKPVVPTLNDYVGDMSDHHEFRLEGHPYLFFSCGRWEHYHRPSDTPDKLSYRKMGWIAKMVEEVVVEAQKKPMAGAPEDKGTLPFEHKWMKKAFGILWPAILWKANLLRVETRKDLDRIVAIFLRQGF